MSSAVLLTPFQAPTSKKTLPIPQGYAAKTSIIRLRNSFWNKNPRIPQWVNINTVGLDQFFTRPDVAETCYQTLLQYIIQNNINISGYTFIEPSAGLGAFYDLLPFDNKIGLDIEQFRPEYIVSDFLAWTPNTNGHGYITVGNPPFGYRAWLALTFLNHAAEFSDIVAFIVPMAFQSTGKSNVQNRVRGLHLAYSMALPADSFIDAAGRHVKVNALWQIWSSFGKPLEKKQKTCNNYIELFTVDMRKERLCGHNRLQEADFFLQRTFYASPPTLVKKFSEVRYVCGYGIVIKCEKKKVVQALLETDWVRHSNLASHNCRHISMCHIRAALIEKGLYDA